MKKQNFVVYVKTDDIYKKIVEDVETRFDNSNRKLNRPLPIGKNKMKGITCWLRAKIYGYSIDDSNLDKKAKGTKSVL